MITEDRISEKDVIDPRKRFMWMGIVCVVFINRVNFAPGINQVMLGEKMLEYQLEWAGGQLSKKGERTWFESPQ